MYVIYQFFPSYTEPVPGAAPQINVWIVSCQATNLVDAEAQMTRFISSGVPAGYLKLLTDTDAVPTGIPSP